MSATTQQPLTENTLLVALEQVECASAIVCGGVAAIRARALVADDGPFPGRFKVKVNPDLPPDAWELF